MTRNIIQLQRAAKIKRLERIILATTVAAFFCGVILSKQVITKVGKTVPSASSQLSLIKP